MKKLIILLSLILICSISYGQAKINRAGPANTVVDQNLNAANSFILPVVADTSAANLLTSLDSCGKLIYTRDVAAIWFRACTGYSNRVWIQVMPSGSPSGQNPWVIDGNSGLFTSPVDPQYVGTNTNQGFGFKSNNTVRLTLSTAGAWGLGAGLDYGTSGYVLTSQGNAAAPVWAAASGSGWSLTGNSGTTAGTNFLGTTDNVDLVFKRNSVESARFGASGNLTLGLTGTTSGALGLSGSTSGLISILPQAAAGTYNFNMPTTAGTSGYLLTSAGGGASPMTWTDASTFGVNIYNANGTLTAGRTVDADGNDLTFTGLATYIVDNALGSEIKLESTFARLIGHGSTDRMSELVVGEDEISIKPGLGVLKIDTLTNNTSQNTLMGWVETTGGDRGEVGYITVGSGLSLAAGVLTATGSGTSWNAITSPTADQALTFDAGESSTWTDANTTEDLFTVNSSTGTTNSMFSLNRTGTALAAGNNILELVSSGANGTNAITATGARISVTNTNGTSGTNVGLAVTATGATTANYAIQATGAMTLTAAAQTPASFESSFAGNMLVPFNSTTSNNVNFAFQKAGVVQWYVGNNASVNRFHILNASAAEAVTVLQGLQVGINKTAPTARLHVGASATTANYGSIKVDEGSRQTTPEDGTINYVSNNLEFTEGSTVYTLAKTLTATATLNFGNTAAGVAADLTVTVTGAAVGDAVYIGADNASVSADNITFWGWVSATNTVTVRFNNNNLVSAVDPASGTFRVVVTKY